MQSKDRSLLLALLLALATLSTLGSIAAAVVDPVDLLPYPTQVYVIVVVLGVAMQWVSVILAAVPRRWACGLRAFATGCFLTASAWFAVYYLPVLPLMVVAVLFGVGLLGLAPNFAVLAGIFTLRDVLAQAAHRGCRRMAWRLFVCGAVVPPALFLGVQWVQSRHGHEYRRAIAGDAKAFAALRRFDAAADIRRRMAASEDTDRWSNPRGRAWPGWPRPESLLFPPAQLDREELARLHFRLDGRAPTDPDVAADTTLELRESRLHLVSDDAAALGYLDWVLKIENTDYVDAEATAELLLPAGGVPCDLTLWVNGVETKAAFGSTRKTTAAYESVVARRRDPALLTDCGAGRIRLRVFPVPRMGSASVRIGLTLPHITTTTRSWRALPVFTSRNFAVRRGHSLRIGDGAAQHLTTLRAGFRGQDVGVRPVSRAWARGLDDDVVVQELRVGAAAAAPPAVLLVIEACARVGSAGIAWPEVEAELRDREVQVLVLRDGGTERRSFARRVGGLAKFVQTFAFTGGVYPGAGLAEALATSRNGPFGTVVWICGGLPEGRPEDTAVVRALARNKDGPRWHALPMAGDNALLRRLLDNRSIAAHSTSSRVPHLLASILDPGPRRALSRAAAPPAGTPRVTDHVVRLWAAQEAARRAEDSAEAASAIAAAHRIVTPWSGAVVLENSDQFKAHDLDPNAPTRVSPPVPGEPIPEPATLLLFAGGLLVLGIRAWTRRA